MRSTHYPKREKKKSGQPRRELQGRLRSDIKFPCVVPPCLTQIRNSGRKFWTQSELIDAIKLNSFLQDQSVDCRVSTIVKLWEEQAGKCAVTGVPLTGYVNKGDYRFDVGIDRINKQEDWHRSNTRLVMLPIAITRAKIKLPPHDKINESWLHTRPFARLILLWLRDAILEHKLVKGWPFTIHFGQPTDYNNMSVSLNLQPIFSSQLKYETIHPIKAIVVNIDDGKQHIEFNPSISGLITISLGDPSVDLPKLFTKMSAAAMRVNMAIQAIARLEEWHY